MKSGKALAPSRYGLVLRPLKSGKKKKVTPWSAAQGIKFFLSGCYLTIGSPVARKSPAAKHGGQSITISGTAHFG